MLVVGVAVPGLAVVALAVLTALGARRRGAGRRLAGVAAIAFPVTWVVWYLRDGHPGTEAPFTRRSSA